jgi:tRNA(Arg) A34 adenosine deaminase TadA
VTQLSPEESQFLARAVALSRKHMHEGAGGPFGAVIVRNGEVLAEGWNEVTSAIDPTAHAEVNAIRKACRQIRDFSLSGATLYTSCEPCPMCLAAAYWARIGRVVYANTRVDAAAIGFDDQHIYDEVASAPGDREIPMLHVPIEDARAVFEEWLGKADRVEY